MRRPTPDDAIEPTRLTIAPPKDAQFEPVPTFAVSPDGRLLVFVARSQNESYLWLKSRSSTALTKLPGTEGAPTRRNQRTGYRQTRMGTLRAAATQGKE